MTQARRIRSYAGRRGRGSALTTRRLETLLSAHALPDGPLDRVAVFGRVAPLVLEIGSGHGDAAVAYAVAHPGHDVLAAEVHTTGVARMLATADEAGVSNLRVVVDDGVPLLEDRVPPGTLDALHVFFPDPWPKARHAKRRLVGPGFLDVAHERLATGGVLLIATDDETYAAQALAELGVHGGFDVSTGERPAWRPVAGFEVRARDAGRVVTEVRAARRDRADAAPGRRTR